jgi:hypothetical protein
MAARTAHHATASELRMGATGLEFEVDGVSHLFTWPEILRRLGSAGSDLTLNVEWGEGWLADRIDWVDLLVFEDEIGVLEHAVDRGGRPAGTLKALVEFEADRIRLYYDESCGGEAGIVEFLHAAGSRMSLHGARFLPLGAKQWIQAENYWFSGSLAY